MKLLITGANGQLGYDLVEELLRRGQEVVASDRSSEHPFGVVKGAFTYVPLDITDHVAVEELFRHYADSSQTNDPGKAAGKPFDAVLHCAAWTAVDAAEAPENQETVEAVNGTGTRYIAEACRRYGCKLLYLSTDYIFDGTGDAPWLPEEADYRPLNTYGRTKLAGEHAITRLLEQYFIVRIAWVFGPHGNNFVKTMLRLGENHETLTVVDDQIGTPTYTPDLARLLADMVETERYGIYHATNEGGYISWYEFAAEIFRQAAALGHSEYDTGHLTLIPVSTAEYNASLAAGTPHAIRPFNSRLDKSKLAESGFAPLPDWKDALRRYLEGYWRTI